MNCILCTSAAQPFFNDRGRGWHYHHCPTCDLRFLDPSIRLQGEQERERYLLHTDDLHDSGYLKFISPLLHLIGEKHSPGAEGLDFGCGRVSALSHRLQENGFAMQGFDPFFKNTPEVLDRHYDFVVAVEVAEHFFHPSKEFHKLRALIKPGGSLFLMTELCSESTDFESWYYRRDPTHVTFYSERSLNWIRENFGFKTLATRNGRVAWLGL